MRPTLSSAPTSSLTIGNYIAPFGDADARGSLAFFARWDRALSAVERLQLQNGAHPLDLPTGLVERSGQASEFVARQVSVSRNVLGRRGD